MQINIGTHEIDYLVERPEIEIRTIRVDQGSTIRTSTRILLSCTFMHRWML